MSKYTAVAGEATVYVQAKSFDEAEEIARPKLIEILSNNTSEIPAEIVVTDERTGRQAGYSL